MKKKKKKKSVGLLRTYKYINRTPHVTFRHKLMWACGPSYLLLRCKIFETALILIIINHISYNYSISFFFIATAQVH